MTLFPVKTRNQGETVTIVFDPDNPTPYYHCPLCQAGNITRTFLRCIYCGAQIKWRKKRE